ncbi:MAG: hypothetical protein ACLR8P_09145 [Clostridium fessum]
MLLLKYPNVYTDTATVFMDSPKNYYEQIFLKNMAPGWLQNNLMDKVMYGSTSPDFIIGQNKGRSGKTKSSSRCAEKIMGENAEVFLGMKGRGYDY